MVSRLSEVFNNESSIRARFGELDFTYDNLCEGLESFKTMMEIEDGNDVLAKLDEVIENSKTWLEELGYSREIYITINEAMKSLYGSEVI